MVGGVDTNLIQPQGMQVLLVVNMPNKSMSTTRNERMITLL